MPDSENQTRAQQLIGDFAPKLVSLTDDLLFGDIWERGELSPRDRSLITVAALISGGNTEQLPGHLERARQNGLTEAELKYTIGRGANRDGASRDHVSIRDQVVAGEGVAHLLVGCAPSEVPKSHERSLCRTPSSAVPMPANAMSRIAAAPVWTTSGRAV